MTFLLMKMDLWSDNLFTVSCCKLFSTLSLVSRDSIMYLLVSWGSSVCKS